MFANGFTAELLIELVRAGLASAHAERMVADGKNAEGEELACHNVRSWANRTRRDSGNDANDPVQTCATRNLAAQMSISNPPFRQSDPETNIDGACDGKCALSAGRNRQHNKLPRAVIRHCHGCYSPLACRVTHRKCVSVPS